MSKRLVAVLLQYLMANTFDIADEVVNGIVSRRLLIVEADLIRECVVAEEYHDIFAMLLVATWEVFIMLVILLRNIGIRSVIDRVVEDSFVACRPRNAVFDH